MAACVVVVVVVVVVIIGGGGGEGNRDKCEGVGSYDETGGIGN